MLTHVNTRTVIYVSCKIGSNPTYMCLSPLAHCRATWRDTIIAVRVVNGPLKSRKTHLFGRHPLQLVLVEKVVLLQLDPDRRPAGRQVGGRRPQRLRRNEEDLENEHLRMIHTGKIFDGKIIT
jgi:hypothetical protein